MFFAFQRGACMLASQGQWVTDSLPVWGRLRRELQGQAVEGRAGDLSLRIELISRGLPQAPLSLLFLCTPSYFEGEEHFSHCLHAHTLADAVSPCLAYPQLHMVCSLEDTSAGTHRARSIFLEKYNP